MDEHVIEISVEPVPSGWTVKAAFNDQSLMFRSGARAEAAARLLVQGAVKAGRAVRLQILDRDGKIVSTTHHSV